MSDILEKNKELKASIDQMSIEEKAIKARINELKNLIEEKKRKTVALDAAKQEEAALLRELGLM
jgi:hypothetical protein